jgi:hypothetical protein
MADTPVESRIHSPRGYSSLSIRSSPSGCARRGCGACWWSCSGATEIAVADAKLVHERGRGGARRAEHLDVARLLATRVPVAMRLTCRDHDLVAREQHGLVLAGHDEHDAVAHADDRVEPAVRAHGGAGRRAARRSLWRIWGHGVTVRAVFARRVGRSGDFASAGGMKQGPRAERVARELSRLVLAQQPGTNAALTALRRGH